MRCDAQGGFETRPYEIVPRFPSLTRGRRFANPRYTN